VERIVEPELMVDDDQALAYAQADFAEPHDAAITRFVEHFPAFHGGRVLDLACGPADVSVRFAHAFPAVTVIGVDGSPPMLAHGVQRVQREGLADRVSLVLRRLPDPDLAGLGRFDAVLCTSSLHHFHDPTVLWDAVRIAAAPGACVLVQDLARPDSVEHVDRFVATYAAGEPDVLQRDYRNSLCAAFTVDEVRTQVAAAGFTGWAVSMVSDRHLLATGHTP
jgi:ubiquinone/menaquinone biosynthesis C-methylase UbiE